MIFFYIKTATVVVLNGNISLNKIKTFFEYDKIAARIHGLRLLYLILGLGLPVPVKQRDLGHTDSERGLQPISRNARINPI